MNKTTVYLIDDEAEMLKLLSDVVELVDMIPQSYTHASYFFEQIEVFTKDSVLVLDLNMPEMDGIEVMRSLATMKNPPVLILISGTDTSVLHAAEKLGLAYDLKILATLSKPIIIDKFRELLEQQKTISINSYFSNKLASNNHLITSSELHHAIHNDQLVLHYQPQVDMVTGRLIGVESLVRWNHPDQGLIYPDHFITLAEHNGLINDLTHWVIDQSIHQEQQWQQQGLVITVSINISADDITKLTLPEKMTRLLTDNRLDPTLLTLEVTENVLMGKQVTSLDILTRLRLKGINLSIDDFGTGYSSLSQLHKIPFTELKIDRSFIANMVTDHEARAIVKTCILLGHELNMQVVAEGIEDKETWDILTVLDCDIAQGYFIAKPMPGNDLAEWVKNRGK